MCGTAGSGGPSHKDFLPTLFDHDLIDNIPRQLASFPVKKVGLAIPDPTASVEFNTRMASMVICGHLIAAIRGTVEFRSVDHSTIMAAGKVETQARRLSESQEKLEVILDDLPDIGSQIMVLAYLGLFRDKNRPT
jgi:hypothetical protein